MDAEGELDDGARMADRGWNGWGESPRVRERPASNHGEAQRRQLGRAQAHPEADGYDWEFLPVRGRSFTDSGSGSCR